MLSILLPLLMLTQTPREVLPQPRYSYRTVHDLDGIGKFYRGREIAQVMGHPAAGWLERPEREKEEEPAKLIALLDIKPGMVVADIGAGSGYHAFRLSSLVGDKGQVLAVDIQQEMLDLITAKAKASKITNVVPVMGAEQDPMLPAAGVDLIMMVDVYHEFSHPHEMTEKMVAALKPGGRLVFVEFKADDAKVPIKVVHTMSERQVVKEMEAFAEMEHVKTVSTLPWQHVVTFKKK
ncbi:class I SAM-dependent methyltransferase [soil metagenome]